MPIVQSTCFRLQTLQSTRVLQTRLRGVEFWTKVGDRYGIDPELKECFYHLAYVPTYTDEEWLLLTNANIISSYSRFMSSLQALRQVKRLITEESDDSEYRYWGKNGRKRRIRTRTGALHGGGTRRISHLWTRAGEEEIEDFHKTSYGNFFSEESMYETLQEIDLYIIFCRRFNQLVNIGKNSIKNIRCFQLILLRISIYFNGN